MPLSMEKRMRKVVKENGYGLLAWALRKLIEHGQKNLVATIIVALCLAPRKTEMENNGVLSVLKSVKLHQAAKAVNLMSEILWIADRSFQYDKIVTTLAATNWIEFFDLHPRYTNPRLGTNDSMMFFTWINGWEKKDNFQDTLCDHAGSQKREYFPHFRMIVESANRFEVRVIGKQMERWQSTNNQTAKALPNGYFEYWIPASTVLSCISYDLDGRTLAEVLEPGVWYNYCFQPDTELDLIDREAEAARREVNQNLVNVLAARVDQLKG